jgi:threonine-phosphate decarboxylase
MRTHSAERDWRSGQDDHMASGSVPDVTALFDRRAHSPSYFAVQEGLNGCAIVDFCVPVNTRFSPPALLRLVTENLDDLLRYYPDYADVHQANIAQLARLSPDVIVPANGATEVISALCQEAAGPILTCAPTFGRWTDLPRALRIPLHTIERCKRDGFQLDVGQIVRRVRETGARTLVLSNPNNPTGAALGLTAVTRLAHELTDLATFVVDESFIDFADVASAASLAARLPHVIVVKSMGKSIGWHGLRLGYGVAAPRRAEGLRSRLPFWNVNGIAAFVLKQLPRFRRELEDSFAAVKEDRAYLSMRLSALPGVTVYPSAANFVLAELPNGVSGRRLRDRLLTRHGVMVRENSNKDGSTEQFIRLAVQRPPAVDTLLRALEEELPLSCISGVA